MLSVFKSNLFTRKNRPSDTTASERTTLEQLRDRFPDARSVHLETIVATEKSTMTSPERVLALCEAVEHLSKRGIEGDIVECGVWRGGSSAAAALTLLRCQDTCRSLWLYDTFSGMTAPSAEDQDFLGNDAGQLLQQHDRHDSQSVWCCSGLEEVRQTMQTTGYPAERIRFVQGPVEQTLPLTRPEKIALLRLDTDWYESTRCELEHLYPRLVPGGVLIIDDYGHWNGCRKAVDDYFSGQQIGMFLNRIDYTGRLGIKPGEYA